MYKVKGQLEKVKGQPEKVKGQLDKVKGQPEKPSSAPSSPVRRVKQENSFKRSLSFGGGANPRRADSSSTHRDPVTPIKGELQVYVVAK